MSWLTDPLPARHIDTDPYYVTPAEEREMAQRDAEQEAELREAISAALHDYRADLYIDTVRRVVIAELNKLRPLPQEPEWQSKTPVPIPEMG